MSAILAAVAIAGLLVFNLIGQTMAWKGMQWAPRPFNVRYDDQGLVPEPATLHWTLRQQPDQGGALNYSWDSFQRPIKEMLGTSICAWNVFRPIGQTPLVPLLMRPSAGMGVFTGGIVHQPLIDPNGIGPGGLTGNPPNLTQGLSNIAAGAY